MILKNITYQKQRQMKIIKDKINSYDLEAVKRESVGYCKLSISELKLLNKDETKKTRRNIQGGKKNIYS
jgi:hypothetical protein